MNRFIIKGKFKRIIYKSNNFNVVVFQFAANQSEIKEKLNINSNNKYVNIISRKLDFELSLDYEIEIEHKVSNNSRYHDNYYLISQKIIIVNEKESIVNFLSSALFKGVSKKSAIKLVDALGIDFINEIEKYYERMIKLIGSKKTNTIIETIQEQNIYNKIFATFNEKQFSISILDLIYEINGKKILNFLKNNIYELMNYSLSFDFLELDLIAKYYYQDYSTQFSNCMLLLYELYKLEFNGSTIIHIENLYKQVNKYRNFTIKDFKIYLLDLFNKKYIVIHDNKIEISSARVYKKEKYIAEKMLELSKRESSFKINPGQLEFSNLDLDQKEAIINSLNNCVSIITGGPGTGKTLLIDLLMRNLKLNNVNNIELLAPTGKAATQITYRTNHEAKTFHSFLKWNKYFFEVNEKNPSEIEVVIIDEFSMINIDLFYDLLVATPKLKCLILIGDKDQIPAIGPGSLLNDFILSDKIFTKKLEKIYRQNEGSLIATNSKLIKDGQFPHFNDQESIIYNIAKIDSIEETIIKVLKDNLDNIDEFQILIPMYNNENGIKKVNKMIQNFLFANMKALFKIHDNFYFYEDKMIQLENDNTKNVFNGEIGKIVDVEFKKNEIEKITLKFPLNKIVTYTVTEFNKNLDLAYAISIHKFQGSEAENILLILLDEHSIMLNRSLFYTAYTRARKRIIIISSQEILQKCLNNDKDSKRKSNILFFLNNL